MFAKNFFSPLSFQPVFGSGIRDPGWVKIRIRDKHPGSATLVATVLGSIPASVGTVESEGRQLKQYRY